MNQNQVSVRQLAIEKLRQCLIATIEAYVELRVSAAELSMACGAASPSWIRLPTDQLSHSS